MLKTLSPDSVSMYQRIVELPPHSHSERVFECFEQDDNTVAVCEYIEGKTLHELLESGRTFPLKDIAGSVNVQPGVTKTVSDIVT